MVETQVAGDVFVHDGDELTEASARWILERIRATLDSHDRCSIALSGGSTPGPIYRRLAHAGLDGHYDATRVDLFLADERCVPNDDTESNARLVHEHWTAIDDRPRTFVFEGASNDLDAEADRYAASLPGRFDLIVLGIGPDGHTASLFPGFADVDRDVIVVRDSPKPPPNRWSLTPRVLADAREIVTIVSGTGKADATRRALEGEWRPTDTPAQLARRGTWFVDSAAASRLAR